MRVHDTKRKVEEQKAMREGMSLLAKRRLEKLQDNIQEQKKLRDMLDKYCPWGKPGGGARNEDIRMHNMRSNELIPDDEQRMRTTFFQRNDPQPRPSYHHYRCSATIKEDPALRFQPGDTVRPEIENKIRYRKSRQEQDAYRQQLDSIVAEQRKARQNLENEKYYYLKQMENLSNPWGKPGPGGFPWRPPPNIGSNFFKSMGWTTENTLKEIEKQNFLSKKKYQQPNNILKLPQIPESVRTNIMNNNNTTTHHDNNDNKENENERLSTGDLTGGIELVPLLAKRRSASIRLPLCTTDVTKLPEYPKAWAYNGQELVKALSQQIEEKHQQILVQQRQEFERCKQHFETWDNLWGRPGHGAPLGVCHQKRRLEELLYKVPLQYQQN